LLRNSSALPQGEGEPFSLGSIHRYANRNRECQISSRHDAQCFANAPENALSRQSQRPENIRTNFQNADSLRTPKIPD
jgi:hypothetical protein